MVNIKQNKMYRYLLLLTISSTLGLEVWLTLFNNFAVETIKLEGNHIGIIQSIREIPGFLTFLIVFALLLIREHRLCSLSVLILGIGIAATGLFPSYSGLACTTLAMSLGYHYFFAVSDSLTLQYFDKNTSPLILGKLYSMGAATNIGAGILIFFLAPLLSFTHMFMIFGCLIGAAGFWGLFQDPTQKDIPPQRTKMIIRKKYRLYYFLTFMAGARRQIFMAFAIFLMVKKFDISVREVTTLFVVGNVMDYFMCPIIGKWIIKFGERKMLSLEYFGLIFIFLAYATAQSRWLIMALYLLDQFFYNFCIAIQTYFQKVGNPKDIASSVSISFSINHIAAVVLPAIGGALWMIDYRIPFVCGAVFSLVSLIAVQKIKTVKDPGPEDRILDCP
ncbi:MAG: MFS transporter [Desulfobacterales bacterium]|nr:MFS transporter [Desulfobacterales bacterium]